MSIKSSQDWWKSLDDNYADIYSICRSYLKPEELEQVKQSYKDRDGLALHHLFELAWWNAPDSRHIHEIPGWGVLCELCSESEVLEDQAPVPVVNLSR